MSKKPLTSKTINKLHFDDLDPIRFEELVLSMVYRMNRWYDINHYGRKGSDDGIDILAVEELENGKKRSWTIQCKRYKSISVGELRGMVDKILDKNDFIPDTLVIAISCPVTKSNIEKFKNYCLEKNIVNAVIWTDSILEAKLYSEYHDLIFAYFGINLSRKKYDRVATVRRNLKLKHKMKKDFLKTSFDKDQDVWERIRKPYLRFNNSKILIRSIDDQFYPENIPDNFGNYPWYKVESFDFYYNGLKVIYRIEEILYDSNSNWNLASLISKELVEKHKLKSINAVTLGLIPFENIIDYDISGDEFYIYPHLYCDFRNMGTPYEKTEYAITRDDGGYSVLPDERRIFWK